MSELVERLRIKADLFATSSYPRSLASMREDARDFLEAADDLEGVQRQHKHYAHRLYTLSGEVTQIAKFLEATARRHQRGALSAAEYTQRLTDCAAQLREACERNPEGSQ